MEVNGKMTSTITTALIMVLSVNALLFLGQIAILETSSEAGVFYNATGSPLCQLEGSGCLNSSYIVAETNPSGVLPGGASGVDPTTGNIFTDAFTSLKSWFIDSLGLGYVVAIFSAPSTFLKALGFAPAVSFTLGAVWYGITLFLIVAFLLGRDV